MNLFNIRTGKSNSRSRVATEQGTRCMKWSVISAMLLVLSGCSMLNTGKDEYGCPGMPGGVQCMSARDVYAATNDGHVPRPIKPEAAKVLANVEKTTGTPEALSHTQDTAMDGYVAPNLPDRPIPIRTPAQVMRIWVAPWEDTNGDLIVTGYVYTEIEARRWVIGDSTPQTEPILHPLQTLKPEPKSATNQ